MGEIAKLSAILETDMRSVARESEKPETRLQTIERLIAACDAIEDLSGSDLIARQRGERAPRHGYPISPTNIDHYVRGRSLHSPEWTGPVRVTIQRDSYYLGYANARENERIKPRKVAKAGLRASQIDLALQSVLPVENRLLLIEEIDLGKKAIRELQLIKQGLSDIPAVDIDAILSGKPSDTASVSQQILSKDDQQTLRALVIRLNDCAALASFGLKLDRDRIVQTRGLAATLMKATELHLLMKLAHYDEIEATLLDASVRPGVDEPD